MARGVVGAPVYGGGFRVEDAAAVPFVLPGEVIELPVAESPFPVVVESAAARVVPGCRHFGVCGGCAYQHAEYVEQTRLKETILRGLFADAALALPAQIDMVAGEQWAYRNRVRFRVERDETGALRIGYNRRGGREFLPVDECPISTPLLVEAGLALIALQGFEEMLSSIAEVEFLCDEAAERLQVSLFVRGEKVWTQQGKGFARFVEALCTAVPQVKGLGVYALPKGDRRAPVAPRLLVEWGAAGLQMLVDGRGYWVSRGGFFQVNRWLTGTLVRLVCAERSGGLAWDLYAGVGLFTKALSERFGRVISVEGGGAASRDLVGVAAQKARRAAREVSAQRGATLAAEAHAMSTVDFLRRAATDRERPELIVLDPPRAGLGAEVCALLGRIAAAELVYVSCDPESLVRDLRSLVDSGYDVAEVSLVDLFPQTFHMETVAVLRRRG